MAEQRLSSAGGQDKKKETGNKLTGQISSWSGLTGPQGSLTGFQIGLTGASNRFFFGTMRPIDLGDSPRLKLEQG